MKQWVLRVPIPTPSLNEIQGKHWAHVDRQKAAMQWAVLAGLSSGTKIPQATGKRKLVITRHGLGTLDADNLAGGCKSLIDALRYRGLILNDDPESIEVIFRQSPVKKEPHTIVLIEEAA